MTKQRLRKERLEKHYATLDRLSEFLGKKQDGKKLSLALFKLETMVHKAATNYCNGENGINAFEWDNIRDNAIIFLVKLFGDKDIPGLVINGDARGYALKIDSDFMKQYESVGLPRDWGGNGILSPEINGEV